MTNRFRAADRTCPLCNAPVPGGTQIRALAEHFSTCKVLARPPR